MAFRYLFTSLILGASLLGSGVAQAAVASCTTSETVGQSCTTAGATANQPGICESVACAALDGGVAEGDAGATCFVCSIDGTAGTCGGGRPVSSSFAPAVGGCCSVAGTDAWGSGIAFFGVAAFVVAFRGRRRAAR